MTYKTTEGAVLTGATSTDIVTALRDGGRFTAGMTLEDYMDTFADRYTEWNGPTEIRTDTPDNFVADLGRYGYLKEIAEWELDKDSLL